ncbi:lariat debranching enzyme [Mycena belliarum]|uniref:Lariat debranching enzyme n=1 Tax=Mycena belliarum TaxID=1033014 RepID=A0AAD6XFP3_9AGAR|nr:lariat debranching enzyme [Mycena belliae]
MKVVVEGCCHGELDAIYTRIQALETRNKYKVDLLLIDFNQAIRNHQDLQCMAVPDNLHHRGGWLAPNIYYLGEAGCVRVNGTRIADASGIFKSHDYTRGTPMSRPPSVSNKYPQVTPEKMPYYDRSTDRSIYHIREYAVRELSLLSPRPQVFLSHDWPQSITDHSDLPQLLKRKKFLRGDIMSGQLGSPLVPAANSSTRVVVFCASAYTIRNLCCPR